MSHTIGASFSDKEQVVASILFHRNYMETMRACAANETFGRAKWTLAEKNAVTRRNANAPKYSS